MLKANNKIIHHAPLVLAILDGWGIGTKDRNVNPLLDAKTPFINWAFKNFPQAKLCASGSCVGLPPKQDGNSEAGHLNLGAGRIVKQDSVIISQSIRDGTFFKNTALLDAIEHVKKYKSQLHLMGLLSNYNSGHSSPDHFQALLKFCKRQQIKRVYIHFFTDGRDSPKYDAIKFLHEVEKRFSNGELIASIVGRFYAMDRKKKWSRTEKTYNLLIRGEGLIARDSETAIRHAYNRGESDEFISPTVIVDEKHHPVGLVKDKDAVIFFNLRSDRTRQMAKPFVQAKFEQQNQGVFKRRKVLKNLKFIAMTDFGPDLGGVTTAFPSIDIKNSLPMVLKKFRQLYISEMEKYAHVTYFFNGGYAQPVVGEERIIIPSPSVSSYDKTPGMSATKITATVLKKLRQHQYHFITLNFPNPDMVAHTGNFRACVEAMEILDKCLKSLYLELNKQRGSLLITSDHGNIEELLNTNTGEINTDHSIYPVPCILINKELQYKKFNRSKGLLADVAPTILSWLGIDQPVEMTGKSLLAKKI